MLGWIPPSAMCTPPSPSLSLSSVRSIESVFPSLDGPATGPASVGVGDMLSRTLHPTGACADVTSDDEQTDTTIIARESELITDFILRAGLICHQHSFSKGTTTQFPLLDMDDDESLVHSDLRDDEQRGEDGMHTNLRQGFT